MLKSVLIIKYSSGEGVYLEKNQNTAIRFCRIIITKKADSL
jgi:hypothetical protein